MKKRLDTMAEISFLYNIKAKNVLFVDSKKLGIKKRRVRRVCENG